MITIRLTYTQALDLLSWVERAAKDDEMDLDNVEQRILDAIEAARSQRLHALETDESG